MKQFCKTPNKPTDIPNHPKSNLKVFGWKGVGDWLGYKSHLDKKFLTYKEAKKLLKKWYRKF